MQCHSQAPHPTEPGFDPFYGIPLKLGARGFSGSSSGPAAGAASGAPFMVAAARALQALSPMPHPHWDNMDMLTPQKVGVGAMTGTLQLRQPPRRPQPPRP
jgi:hypothetical protein